MQCFVTSGPYSIVSSLPSVEDVDKLLDHGLPSSVNSVDKGYLFSFVICEIINLTDVSSIKHYVHAFILVGLKHDYRQHCAQRNASVFNLLRGRF